MPYGSPIRRNGFSPPYTKEQVASWIALVSTFLQFLFVVTPILPLWDVSIPITVLFLMFVSGTTYFGIVAMATDPADIHLIRHWKERGMDEVLPKEGKFILAIYDYFNSSLQSNYASKPLPEEPMKHCWICDAQVADHSMHCKFCNKCVYRFDHHCLWLNTCVGAVNYKYFFRVLLYLVSMELMHFIVQLVLLIDLFTKNGGTEQRARQWLGVLTTKILLFIFLIFSGASVFMVGQLLSFHLKLRRRKLTTYQFIVSEHASNREKSRKEGDLQQRRLDLIRHARSSKNFMQVFKLQCGGLCRQIGLETFDPLYENHKKKQDEKDKDLEEQRQPKAVTNNDDDDDDDSGLLFADKVKEDSLLKTYKNPLESAVNSNGNSNHNYSNINGAHHQNTQHQDDQPHEQKPQPTSSSSSAGLVDDDDGNDDKDITTNIPHNSTTTSTEDFESTSR